MTAEQFTHEFRALMVKSLTGSEVPIFTIIFELDKAHHNALHLLAISEAQAAQQKILPANGAQLPPFPNRG